MIINAQENDVKLQGIVQLVRNGDKTDYSIEGVGGLYYKNKLCVPNVQELKKKLMNESHNILFTIHPRGNKMYQDLKQYYFLARDEKGYSRVCIQMFDLSASKS